MKLQNRPPFALSLVFAAATSVAFCTEAPVAEPFGKTKDGTPVEAFTLKNKQGVKLRAITYGATVVSLETPDNTGKFADIVLGYKTVGQYEKASPYFGAIVGRFGNRIAAGKFTLDGKEYTLALNNGADGLKSSLHGGNRGFDKVVWKAEGLVHNGEQGVRFSYMSRDGEEGYPGNLNAKVTYWLNDKSEWRVDYELTTDKATPVNLTQHSYFNLKGEGRGDILGHELSISAAKFTPVNQAMIPTGELRPVAGTPLDFNYPTPIGARIGADDEQLKLGGGYDHNFVLKRPFLARLFGKHLFPAATVHEPASGRVLTILTSEPGIQFYSGNFLDGTLSGKAGASYPKRSGFCLETQHYPDSPNQPSFPSCILRPGKVLKSTTVFKFGVTH
jgi:aldose 1-epimerase